MSRQTTVLGFNRICLPHLPLLPPVVTGHLTINKGPLRHRKRAVGGLRRQLLTPNMCRSPQETLRRLQRLASREPPVALVALGSCELRQRHVSGIELHSCSPPFPLVESEEQESPIADAEAQCWQMKTPFW